MMLSQTSSKLFTWQDEVRTAFKDSIELSKFLGFEVPHVKEYPLFIPRSFASKIKTDGKDSVLALQFLPQKIEQDEKVNLNGFYDPIGDQAHAKGGQIIHRYHNRVLFAPTTKCPINCRYCFRKNELSVTDEIFKAEFDKTLEYLLKHEEINEIIFTGGDPLFLSNKKIEFYLAAFSKIPHIKYIRFHTRFPIIIPSRLDSELTQIIKSFKDKFSKILFVLHTNHHSEIDDEVSRFIQNSGFEWLSQSVLLNGVNNSKETLKNLFYKLSDTNIRPYYLHHPDHVKGAMHFYLPIEEGRRLFHELRDEIPGWLLPQYILDVPGGHGKILASNPESFSYSGTLIDRKGQKHEISL